MQIRKYALKMMLRKRVRTVKNKITLKIDAELVRELRVLAGEEGTSVSTLLTTHLERLVRDRKGYERSKKRALSRLRGGFELNRTNLHSRDELHER